MSNRPVGRRDRLFHFLLTVLLLIAAGLVAALLFEARTRENEVQRAPVPTNEPGATAQAMVLTVDGVREGAQTPSPQPEVTPEPETVELLPVYRKAETDEKVIAITLDECTNVSALERAVAAAVAVDAKLTLLPSGKSITGQTLARDLRTCVFEYGFEIENRTWNNQKLYSLPLDEMAQDLWATDVAVDYVLNRDYGMHLVRPYGGYGTMDPRTNAYLKKLGYDGFLTWSVNASGMSMDALKLSLEPGAIYLFSCRDADVTRLEAFLDFAVNRDYRVVTASALLGFGEVSIAPLSGDILARTMPSPDEYEMEDVTFYTGDRAWQILLLQGRLAALGYMSYQEADGVYGDGTARAVMNYQAASGLICSGIATPELQRMLFDGNGATAPPTPSPTPDPDATPLPEGYVPVDQRRAQDVPE